MRCTYCGSHLHTYANCPKTWGGSVARMHMRCSYCGGKDHNYNGCLKIRAAHTIKPDDIILDPHR